LRWRIIDTEPMHPRMNVGRLRPSEGERRIFRNRLRVK
jgi:hypothetical protein